MDKRIIVILFAVVVGCSQNPGETGFEVFPDMIHSIPLDAYSENSIMKDGKTMQLPPINTIARGNMPFEYGAGTAEAKRAGNELSNPFENNKINLARGSEVYTNFCLVCHGPQGKGDGPLIPKFPNPPSLTSKRLRKYKDGHLFHIISKGAGDMPSHAEQISQKDRWLLVHYVNFIQQTYSKKR